MLDIDLIVKSNLVWSLGKEQVGDVNQLNLFFHPCKIVWAIDLGAL